jgi:hypothetical protein
MLNLSCQTNDTLDMGQDSKRSQNRAKIGVETPKGLTFIGGNHNFSLIFEQCLGIYHSNINDKFVCFFLA